MDQQPLEDVIVLSQMGASHAAGVVAMGEGPLDQLTALPQQPLAFRPLQPLSIRIDQSLLIFLARPMPLPGLLFLGNIRPDANGLHLLQCWPAVVSLIRDYFLDPAQMA